MRGRSAARRRGRARGRRGARGRRAAAQGPYYRRKSLTHIEITPLI